MLQPLIGSDLNIKTDSAIAGVCWAMAGSTAVQILAPTNIARTSLMIYSTSSGILYILAANQGTVSSSYFSVALNPQEYWELPSGVSGCYKGPVTGIFVSATGAALVTEFA